MDQEIKDLIAAAETGTDSDTSSDVALARMLQMQYDKEHNEILKAEERKYNGTNKGEIILFQGHIIFLKDGRPYLFHSFRKKYFNKISLGNMLYFQNKL